MLPCLLGPFKHEEYIWKVGALFNAPILVYAPQLILMLMADPTARGVFGDLYGIKIRAQRNA